MCIRDSARTTRRGTGRPESERAPPPRARSAAPVRGEDPLSAVEASELRAQLEEMRAERDAAAVERDEARGTLLQLQALEADRDAIESPTPENRRTGNEDTAGGDGRRAIHDLTRPPPATTPHSHVHQARAKEDIKAWCNPSTMKLWVLVGERPTVCGLKTPEMQAVLHETVKVTPVVLDQLNSMSGFRVRLYVAENDEPRVTRTPLYLSLIHI